MTAPQTSRVAAASLLLGGVAWAQTAFVPAAGRVGQVQSPPQLRGAAGAAAAGAEGSAESLGATALLPVGPAAASLAVASIGAQHRRPPATQRAEVSAETWGATTFLPVGLVAASLAVASLKAQHRRQPATQRRFSSGGSAPTPAENTSKKDFSDPFLGPADLGFDPTPRSTQAGWP